MPQKKPVDSKVYDKSYFEQTDGALFFFENKTAPKFNSAIKKCNLSPGDRALDIGCGRGDLVIALAKHQANAVGLDYSEEALSIAHETVSDLSEELQNRIFLINSDATKLAFPKRSFDFVFLMDIAEHLSSEQLLRCFQESHRILKENGKLIVHTSPNRWYNDFGYPFWEQPINKVLNLIFKQELLTRPIRNEIDLKVHINEQTILSLKKSLEISGFHPKVWLGHEYIFPVKKSSIIEQVLEIGRQVICHGFPFSMVPPLNFLFCNNIWAICKK